MAVESKASLTNSDTPGLVEISSSSSCVGYEENRQQRKRRATLGFFFFLTSQKVVGKVQRVQCFYLLYVTDGNWRRFWSDIVYKEITH